MSRSVAHNSPSESPALLSTMPQTGAALLANGAALKGKRLLLVNTGTARKRFVLQRLKKLGMVVVALNKDKNWAASYVDEWLLVDPANHEAAITAALDLHKKQAFDGVLTFWEDDVILTAKLAEKLKLPGISQAVAQKCRNKFAFRQFCVAQGLPAPAHRLIQNRRDLQKAAKELQFPVVLKPSYGSSSAFVIKAEDEDDLLHVYDYVQQHLSTYVESALRDGSDVLIEEYIEGDEVDLDLLVQNGKIKFWSITDNYLTQEPFFVETGFASPSNLAPEMQQQLLQMAEMVLEKMGIYHGCLHFEAKFGRTGPMPIEINLRMGGGEVYANLKEVWHVDIIEYAAKIATGTYFAPIAKPALPYSYVSGMTLNPEKSGVIASLNIPTKWEESYRVVDFAFFKEIGDSVLTPPAEYDYLGWVSVAGDNPNDARDNLDQVLKKIVWEIVPFSGGSAMGKTQRRHRYAAALLHASVTSGAARIEKLRFVDRAHQRKLHVGIACNEYTAEDGEVEAELSSVGRAIERTLQARNYRTTYIDFNNLPAAIEQLRTANIDLVFNVGERLNDSSLLEPHIAAILDAFQVPYTGSNPFTLGLCIDKIRVKKLLTYHAIPTPKWDYLYDIEDDIRSDLTYPLIVKPGNTDNSIGITNNSVVANPKELKQQLEYVMKELRRPALIEEYLEGDEYDVSILGTEPDDLRVLPPSRTIYTKLPEGVWHIMPFEAKYGHWEYEDTIDVQRPPKNVSKKLLALIDEIALDTYNILDCHDYGRIEIKLDRHNNPHVLELNPNPSINEGLCVPGQASLIGLDYGDFLEEIIALAIKRYKDRPPYHHLQAVTT